MPLGVAVGLIKTLIREANARGGVNTISVHREKLATGKNTLDNFPAFTEILPGGGKHDPYLKTLDRIVAFLKDLEREDGTPIPIVPRPYREHTQGRSWWGAKSCSEADSLVLWRMTVRHFRDSREFHRLPGASQDRLERRTWPGPG